eukprot:TRINITY_DN42013_c0_g1_i1.p1 TRINITY_DN42013_c0_g1~~TRINITY_DN42013_c0_g1_i1.p1  ORF type:complete len:610 (+),score=242.26 TRINITY_DN42013_c0_g1_i1:81-1910(+)
MSNMDTITGKLAVFSGKGVKTAQDLATTFKEHTAILRPFIETCGDALASCYPDLYGADETMGNKKFDLIEALETNTLHQKLAEPAVEGSLSTISQMANFFLHMKQTGKGMDESTSEFVATTGDRSGLLSAVAIASSATDAEFGHHAAKAVRAAFYAGKAQDGKVEEEWKNHGIVFTRPRIPCISSDTALDLRESEDLTHEVAELVKTGKDKADWNSVYQKSKSTGVMGFGASMTPEEYLKAAITEAGGKADKWQVESAGVGGVSWEAVGITSDKQECDLVRELRACPYGAGLPQNIMTTYPSPGDLLKTLKDADSLSQPSRAAWEWKDVNWAMVILMIVTHAVGAYGFVWAVQHELFWRMFTEVMILYPMTGMMGITAGAHRLWSHRSYKAHFPARLLMMVANSIANQGSIFHWARDHRVHHAKSDTEADPHDITRGFFYSHMGWLLLKKRQAVKEAGKQIDCSDLLKDPLVWIQHVCDPWWNMFFCFVLPGIYTHYMYGEFWLGFCFLGAFRWLLCLHATWTVNSVAHTFGSRPYTPTMYPSESWFTTLVAVGEGYHNWHHTYPYDYSASELGCFNCFNPTTAFIDSLAVVGQVWGRKRAVHRKPKSC